jgi:hypothetical protein
MKMKKEAGMITSPDHSCTKGGFPENLPDHNGILTVREIFLPGLKY